MNSNLSRRKFNVAAAQVVAGSALGTSMLGMGSARAQAKSVTVGYQTIVGPFPMAIANGDFEKATGAKIDWRQFTSAGDISAALASGDVPIGVIGSTGIAAAVSRGVDVELFWILDDIGQSEQLVARNGSGIKTAQDLVGKKVAVPFVSTSHFHLLVALERIWKIAPSKVQILNMKPPEIVAAWTRGDIDAAYVWPPALTTLLKTGHTIVTSEEVGQKSVPTFDGLIVDRKWAAKNPQFMAAFCKVLAQAYAGYLANKAAWTADSPQIKAMTKMVGGDAADNAEAMKMLGFPDVQAQVSPTWLGGGKNGKAVQALTASAQFLKEQRQIDTIPADYSAYVTAKYAEAGAK